MKISVLIPAFNAEKYIEETLNSIFNQTYKNFEILIADDCSTDNTKKIINNINSSNLIKLHNERNLKKPLTVQKLFQNSTGEIITIHDADDISLPNRFERMVHQFKQLPHLGMCGHIIERISEKGKPLGLYRNKISDYKEIKKRMQHDNTDGDPSMFIRRSVLVELGQIFRPYFNNNMDYDLALRIIEKNETSNVTEVLSYYRNVPGSISKGVHSYKKLVTQKMTQFFAMERKEKGSDALMREDWELIRRMETEFSQPYLNDPTLHYRQMASFFMYTRMNFEAIKYMFKAINKEPFKWNNWHTLQYCLRKTLIGF